MGRMGPDPQYFAKGYIHYRTQLIKVARTEHYKATDKYVGWESFKPRRNRVRFRW